MNVDRAREFLLKLPHVVEAEQFGGLVFWVGDKALGGKMFVMVNPESGAGKPISYPAGEEHFHELCEQEGIVPAPYLARIFWVSAERWDVLRNSQWEYELRAAHALTLAKLPPKTRAALELPAAELKKLLKERRALLAAREAAAKSARAAKKRTRSIHLRRRDRSNGA